LPPATTIDALLRLGTKYEITHVKQDALYLLSDAFPCTLQAFDKRYPCGSRNDRAEATHFDDGLHLLVRTARVPGLSFLLPALYLRIFISMSHLQIIDGKLEDIDLKNVLRAECKLVYGLETTLLSWLWTGLECKSPSCEAARGALLHEDVSIAPSWTKDEVLPTFHWISAYDNWIRICHECRPTEDDYNEARQSCWNALPQYCGLENWPTLEAQRLSGASIRNSDQPNRARDSVELGPTWIK
jgi:hypothetical protein